MPAEEVQEKVQIEQPNFRPKLLRCFKLDELLNDDLLALWRLECAFPQDHAECVADHTYTHMLFLLIKELWCSFF